MSVVAGQDEEPVPACRGQPDGQRAARDKRTVPSQLAWETGEVPVWVPVVEPGEGVKEGHKVTRGSPESQVFLFSLRESFTSSRGTEGQLSSAQLEGQLHPNISGPIASTATSATGSSPFVYVCSMQQRLHTIQGAGEMMLRRLVPRHPCSCVFPLLQDYSFGVKCTLALLLALF